MTTAARTNPPVSGQKPDILRLYADDIKARLRALGAVGYDLVLPETHFMPRVLRPDETILGVVYGRYRRVLTSLIGRGVLIATDQRLLLVDRKPMYANVDEFVYDAIGGVDYSHAVLAGTVTVHAVGGDIKLRTFNDKCARIFTAAVDNQLLTAR